MTKDEKDRIEKLEDDRFERLIDQVDELHKCILGNGSAGLKEKVAVNTVRIKIIMWVVGVCFSAMVGAFMACI